MGVLLWHFVVSCIGQRYVVADKYSGSYISFCTERKVGVVIVGYF